jgi:deoxyhypusine synthase
LKRVKGISLHGNMKVEELLKEYGKAGVLGAGALAEAQRVLEEMLQEDVTVFLGIAGPLTSSGLRPVIRDLIKEKRVSAVVTSGANVVHDMIEAFGGCHYGGRFDADDVELRKRKIGRIGNVYIELKAFEVFERKCQEMFIEIGEDKRGNLSIRELLWEIGSRLDDEGSFLRAAYDAGVPVFSPALVDSMLGLQLFFFSQEKRMVLNAVKDMKEIADMVFEARKTGAIILGGGVSKHYILGVNTLRGGIDYGVQITMDREEAGSLSGAKLEEAISWGKAEEKSKLVSLVGDATVLFPLLAAGIKERLK